MLQLRVCMSQLRPALPNKKQQQQQQILTNENTSGKTPNTMKKEQKLCSGKNFFYLPHRSLQRSLGGGNGNPPLYFCPEKNPMNRRAWWATVHGVSECTTWLSKWVCNPSLNRTPECQGYPLRGILPHREKVVCGRQISSLLLWTSLTLCTDDPCSLRWHWREVLEPRAPTPVSPPQG